MNEIDLAIQQLAILDRLRSVSPFREMLRTLLATVDELRKANAALEAELKAAPEPATEESEAQKPLGDVKPQDVYAVREVWARLCRLQQRVWDAKSNGDDPADCFCGEGGYWPLGKAASYRNSGWALDYIERAVDVALAADTLPYGHDRTSEPTSSSSSSRKVGRVRRLNVLRSQLLHQGPLLWVLRRMPKKESRL